jgi:type I restriction enzyme M protein
MPANHADIEKRLWDAAGELCVNPKLRVSEYSVALLGLILLRSAHIKFVAREKEAQGRETQRLQTLSTVPHVPFVPLAQRLSSHVRSIRRKEVNATKPTQLDRQLHLGHC